MLESIDSWVSAYIIFREPIAVLLGPDLPFYNPNGITALKKEFIFMLANDLWIPGNIYPVCYCLKKQTKDKTVKWLGHYLNFKTLKGYLFLLALGSEMHWYMANLNHQWKQDNSVSIETLSMTL